ncbi:MAG: sodC [Phycisphaerales bacterium]|nr:sodC [Phycisphaerales bacterium]MDB5304751.1 sodC [Phycisphaerales bacterium]
MQRRFHVAAATLLAAGALLIGRGNVVRGADPADAAVAHIHGAGDNKDKITGTATFTPADGGVKVVVEVKGLTPGKHGIHIHEKPDLSKPDLTSAGPHFNPTGHKHGGPDGEHHAGDLGNLEAGPDGSAHLEETVKGLSIAGAKDGVIGHSVIIHEKEDDLKSDPAGNSGKRIAGGAIEAQKAEK